MGHDHENRGEENRRFREACQAANLSNDEIRRFSEIYHKRPSYERQRMSFNDIRNEAAEWKRNNGGGYRRSDDLW